ncbi:MAG TPA: HEPN domain-containing protein [Steroidobacteraceae bacterium]|nr:HEPN domain-containing protein [Steroidobacteraceae bacterium]
MTNLPLARNLVRKSKRALLSAKVGLQIGDSDNAVNRSYYAMFDIARAALLTVGVPEDKLPRTHNGVIAAFRQHAVESGKIDADLAGSLSRAEALRLQADYAGTEIDPKAAAGAVTQAETFVNTVERAFPLEESVHDARAENKPGHNDKVSDVNAANQYAEIRSAELQPYSLQEEQRKARENWLKYRKQEMSSEKGGRKERDAGRDAAADRGHSPDDLDD